MDRRDFLKHSVLLGLTGVGASAASGCATTGLPATEPSAEPVDMHAYVARLDRSLGLIQHADFFRDLRAVAHQDPVGNAADFSRRESLARKSLRAMTITAAFLDLSVEDRQHPAMQARMWGALDEMDDAVIGTAEMLAALPASERLAVQHRLRTEQDLMRDTAAALDAKAALAGLPPKHRRHMERMYGHAGWRMREEDPSVLIDAYVDLVAKNQREVAHRAAQAASGSPAPAATGAAVYPSPQSGTSPAPSGSPSPTGQETVLAPVAMQPAQIEPMLEPGEDPRIRHRRAVGHTMLTTGGITLGIGAVVTGVGLALLTTNAALAGAFMITFGVIGLIAGLVVLIIGAVRS